ncbi:MAG: hypothetical protein GXP38_02240 [Chloroflexi bacterium]|nr:hypothetical protein [Chloroflexota bacterium]
MSSKRRKKRPQSRKRSSQIQNTEKRWYESTAIKLLASLFVVVAVVALLAFFTQKDNDEAQSSEPVDQPVEIMLDRSIGPEDAAVVVTEYGDFQ